MSGRDSPSQEEKDRWWLNQLFNPDRIKIEVRGKVKILLYFDSDNEQYGLTISKPFNRFQKEGNIGL